MNLKENTAYSQISWNASWFTRQHPYMPQDSGYISIKHIKSKIADELTISLLQE